MEDLCGLCPTPKTVEERELCETKFVDYVNGRIAFMVDDPGKQLVSSSYHPITDTDWTELAYLNRTEALMRLVVQGDTKTISDFLDTTASDPKERKRLTDPVKQLLYQQLLYQRDHAGRSPLHMAIISGQTDVALLLVDRGARITARLVDGRNCLMLAAQNANADLVRAMLNRSMANAKQVEILDQQVKKDNRDALSDRIDEDLDVVVVADPHEEEAADMAEDAPPDVLDVNFVAWDSELSALFFAIIAGSTESVKLILDAGASARKSCKEMAPISAALLIKDDAKAIEVIKVLLSAGATCNQIYKAGASDLPSIHTPPHVYVASRRTRLTVALLQGDPLGARKIVNFPIWATDHRMHSNKNSLASALTVACATSQYGVAALLMKFGARAVITLRDRDDFFRIPKVWQWFLVPSLTSKLTSQTLKPDDYDLKTLQDRRELWSPHATQPLEASMAAMNNIWKLLLYGEQAVPRLLGTQHSFFEDHTNILPKLTLLDAAERLSNTASMELGSAPSGICIDEEDDGIEKQQEEEISKKAPRMNDFANWKDWWTAFHRHKALTEEWSKGCIQSRPAHQRRQQSLDHLVEILTSIQLYYSDLATELRQRGAKTIHEIKSCLPALDRPKESVDQNKRRLSASYKSESNDNQWQEFQGRRPAKIRKHQSDAL
ncbi:hypothetical protein L7F22_018701 [Adiantum nelumboides]|nr:hypothetical protein [Adiantum nelumboides]